ncbi:hypothetical protein N7519_005977 [Penicillium mononematosum]|uniref:uncharacterized protein n=1 Tax=Penicillium mononematosum TaxID=268346 RepID=UPI00254903B0|nr:uncharacterized protein N7519_005977 [Penicillium mononematosum]KAJ6184676.1 hypothetical protein N7519_005977 [Penicillium mononematosum]
MHSLGHSPSTPGGEIIPPLNIVNGDLHLGNILVQFPEFIDRYSTSELYEKFGKPQSEAVVRQDSMPLSNGIPTHVFIPGWFGVRSVNIALRKERIILGASENLSTLMKRLGLFRRLSLSFSHLRPDSLMSHSAFPQTSGHSPIFGQRPLFDKFFATADCVTAEQVEALGILPPEWWEKWHTRLEWFTEDGEIDMAYRGHDNLRRTWDVKFDYSMQNPRAKAGPKIVTERERKAFEAMLRSMLTFQPGERATAQQILQSEWMKDWGQPALEESWRTFHSAKG